MTSKEQDDVRKAAEEIYVRYLKSGEVTGLMVDALEYAIAHDRARRDTIDLNNLKKKEHKHISLTEARDIAMDSIPKPQPAPPIYGFEDMEDDLEEMLTELAKDSDSFFLMRCNGVGWYVVKDSKSYFSKHLDACGYPIGFATLKDAVAHAIENKEEAARAALDELKGKGDA